MLAVIEVAVLVPHDRQDGLVCGLTVAAQLRQLPRLGVLVGHRHQRYGQADLAAEFRAPETGRGHHDVGVEHLAGGGADAAYPAVAVEDVDHLLVADEPRAPAHRPLGLHGGGAQRTGQPVGRGVETAENAAGVEQRMAGDALVGTDQLAGDAVRPRPAELAVQIGPALRRGGDLDAANLR